jgi:hypothetical protein
MYLSHCFFFTNHTIARNIEQEKNNHDRNRGRPRPQEVRNGRPRCPGGDREPMLRVIEDETAIKRCHALFVRSFKSFKDEDILANIGHQGASSRMKVSWSGRLGLWSVSRRVAGNPHWNAFGLEKPERASHIPIVCEINFPLRGIDRRLGGAMAKDRSGRLFAVHRGKIGGGKKGIGKTLFEDLYRGAWAVMEDGDMDTAVALIGELQSPRFARQAAQFVRKVDAIKNHISPAAQQLTLPFDHRLREELIGNGCGSPVQTESAACDHGLVVADLYADLVRMGLAARNGDECDLTAEASSGSEAAVFGIVTDPSPDTLYAASTRLLLQAAKADGATRKFLVIPAGKAARFPNDLDKLGIERIEYRWQDDRAVFDRLPEHLPMNDVNRT